MDQRGQLCLNFLFAGRSAIGCSRWEEKVGCRSCTIANDRIITIKRTMNAENICRMRRLINRIGPRFFSQYNWRSFFLKKGFALSVACSDAVPGLCRASRHIFFHRKEKAVESKRLFLLTKRHAFLKYSSDILIARFVLHRNDDRPCSMNLPSCALECGR
jgi:hypothetical protein